MKLRHALLIALGITAAPVLLRAADDVFPTAFMHITNFGAALATNDDVPPSSFVHVTNLPSTVGQPAIWGVYDVPELSAGSGYAVADTITLSIAGATAGSWQGYSNAVANVYETQVVSATVQTAGSSCGGTSATITGTTGTGTPFQGTVAVSGGGISGPITITVPGVYSANMTDHTQEPVTGDSCSGSKVNATMGVLRVYPGNSGYYTAIAALTGNAVTQSASSGAGTGFTATASFAPLTAGEIPKTQNVSDPFGNTSYGYKALFANASTYSTAVGYKALFQSPQHANEAFGAAAGASLISGTDNVFIGADSGNNDDTNTGVTAFNSVGLGTHTLGHLTSGNFNIAIGSEALVGCGNWVGFPACTLTGTGNIGIGHNALQDVNGAPAENTVVGYNAGSILTTGSRNIILGGDTASATLQTGSNNVLLGTGTTNDTASSSTVDGIGIGQNVKVGSTDVCIGKFSCGSVSADSESTVAIGQNAGHALTSGTDNTLVGGGAGIALQSGIQNVFVGRQAGQAYATTGSATAIGWQALLAATGAKNAALGHAAGKSIVGGANNLILGSDIVPTTLTTGSRNIILGTANTCDATASGMNDTFQICTSTTSGMLMAGSLVSATPSLQMGASVIFSQSSADAISAAGSSSQSAATVLAANINKVTTVGANAGVALPACTGFNVGADIVIMNYGANTLLIWPVNGGSDAIDGAGANTNKTLSTTNRIAHFYCVAANQWRSALGGAVSS